MPTETGGSAAKMDALIERVQELHSSPMVAYKVLHLLKDPEFQVSDVERHLAADPALAASILRLVNSSYFAFSDPITSLRQAVTLIGTRSLRLAVLSFGLVDRLTQGAPAEVCGDFWRRALTMAVAASRLCAAQEEVPPDEVYSAGLLADLGVLVFAQADTDRYIPLYAQRGHQRGLVEAEQRHFGFDHGALGARLLCQWNLPESLTHAVAHHYDACAAGGLLDRAVVAGDMMADVLWTPKTPRLPVARRFLESQFDLDLDAFISLASACQGDVTNSAELFEVELAGGIDCRTLRLQALRRHRAAAMETALDFDSLTAIQDHDFA